jgi:hypothetical protein
MVWPRPPAENQRPGAELDYFAFLVGHPTPGRQPHIHLTGDFESAEVRGIAPRAVEAAKCSRYPRYQWRERAREKITGLGVLGLSSEGYRFDLVCTDGITCNNLVEQRFYNLLK